MENRKGKKEEMIKEIAARFIERESNKTALITVTRVALDDKARNGMIYVTVLPESGEESAINFLKRKRKELREAVTKGLPVHPIPFLDVAIDDGEKARQNIEALLKEE
jgi:ribosome-binding factor A